MNWQSSPVELSNYLRGQTDPKYTQFTIWLLRNVQSGQTEKIEVRGQKDKNSNGSISYLQQTLSFCRAFTYFLAKKEVPRKKERTKRHHRRHFSVKLVCCLKACKMATTFCLSIQRIARLQALNRHFFSPERWRHIPLKFL